MSGEGILKYFESNYETIVKAAQQIDYNFPIQDCVNDVYLQMAERCPSLGFDSEGHAMSYILASIKNRYYDEKVRETRYTTPPPEETPDDSLEDRTLKLEMANTLDEIHDDIFNMFGEDYAYIFYLRYMENLTYAAIAVETESSNHSVFRRVLKIYQYVVEKYGV